MYEKIIIENPEPLKPYFVESNKTGEREVCILTRNVWNLVESGAFFAYASTAVAVSEAEKCENCGEWSSWAASFADGEWCENCIPF